MCADLQLIAMWKLLHFLYEVCYSFMEAASVLLNLGFNFKLEVILQICTMPCSSILFPCLYHKATFVCIFL